ncbi:MAG: hypothetical protein L3J66_02095 [Bacteroidales bacterium]|nr:hypothetical protein [Bacteroidales bacterium]
MKPLQQTGRAIKWRSYFLFFLMGILLSLPFSALAQEEEEEVLEEEIVEKQVVSLSELAALMNADESEIILSDLEIVIGKGDETFRADKIFYSVYEIYPKGSIAKKVYFYNCTFNTGAEAPIVFNGWTFRKLNLIGCEINSPLTFENFKTVGNYPVHIENCSFAHALAFKNEIFELNKLQILNSTFRKELFINTPINQLLLDNCRFDADTIQFKKEDEEMTHFQMSLKNQSFGEVEINNCRFTNNGTANLFSLDFSNSSIESLRLFNNNLQSLDLSWATVEKSLLIDSLTVRDYIGILNFDFPDKNTNIPWYNLGGEKLAVFYTGKSELIIPFQAKSNEELANTLRYNDLISAYTKFNTLYHDRGDITSANASYVEIKTIETRRQAFVQEVNPSFNNLINYKLNVFLSFFSDFATNPGKSLIQSLWVLLIFTVLYMFSFSDWDGLNYNYYLSQYRLFAKYIIKDKSVKEVYKTKDNPHQDLMQQINDKYLKKGKDIPRSLRFFGKPLHYLGKFRFEMMPGLIRLFNFQPHAWASLSASEKIKSGFLITLILLSFIIYILVVKFINAFILSLNSFVVIGFGMLPERGLAMYLSIVEGIIGWFLLTIFTITLLSQVLQGAG